MTSRISGLGRTPLVAIATAVSMVTTVVVLPGALVAAGAATSEVDSGYTLTVAARYCDDYTDVTANRSRDALQETFSPLGADSPYPGAFPVNPTAENSDPAQRDHCKPLPNWTFTLGAGISGGSATDLSVVTGANGTAVTEAGPIHALSPDGTWDGTSTISGATTTVLTEEQAALGQVGAKLWVQGGVPSPRAGNEGQLNGQQDKYAFASMRCSVDAVHGDNVEYALYPDGVKHVYCFAYYVDKTDYGTITLAKKTTTGDTSTPFHFASNVDYANDGDITLKGGQSSDDYVRAVTGKGDDPWFFQEKDIPSGWSLHDLTCTTTAENPSTWTVTGAKVAISLTKGDHVTCTYTDTEDATLVVHKSAPGGSDTQFPFVVDDTSTTITGNSSKSFTYADLSAKGTTVDVTEGTLPEGWAQTGTPYCTVNGGESHQFTDGAGVAALIKPGQKVDCYFTNEFSEGNLATADVTVVKHISGDTAPEAGFGIDVTKAGINGSEATTDSLEFTTDGQSSTVVVPTLADGRAVTVKEQANPAGWTLTAASCTLTSAEQEGSEPAVGTVVTGENAIALTVAPGQHWTCDYTNVRDTATLVLHKASISGDGTFAIAPVVDGALGTAVTLTTVDGSATSAAITIPVDGTTTVGAREADVTGWSLTDAYCTVNGGAVERPDTTFPLVDESGTTPAVASVGRGDKVDCYFIDTADPTLPDTGGTLPQTGAPAGVWGGAGVVGLLLGSLLVVAGRRREGALDA
jgi:LPXTG-motif cell wall-anchored protein